MSKQTIPSPSCMIVVPGVPPTSIGYFPAANTDTARGDQLILAVADWVTGGSVGIISLFGNCQVSANIAANGLIIECNGFNISRVDSAAGFIATDGGSAITFWLRNAGTLTRTIPAGASIEVSGTVGIAQSSNASSDILIETQESYFTINDNAVDANDQGAYLQTAGNMRVYGRRSTVKSVNTNTGGNTAMFWWLNGNMVCNVAENIRDPASTDNGCFVAYMSPSATPTGDFYFNFERINAGTKTAISLGGSEQNAAYWFTGNTLTGNFSCPSNKLYLALQKHIGVGAVSGTGQFYPKYSKMGGALASASAYLKLSGGITRGSIDQFEPGTNSQELIKVSGGTHFLDCMDLTASSVASSGADANAVLVSAGTLNLLKGYLTKASSTKSLVQSGGTLAVGPAVHYLAADTTGTITTLNLFGVVPGSTFKSTTIGT